MSFRRDKAVSLNIEVGTMTLAEQIRDFVERRYIAPARRAGSLTVTINVGDVHREMGFHNRVPAVCSALGSKLFESQCGVVLAGWDGPKQSTSVQITYSFGSGTVVSMKRTPATAAVLAPVTADDFNAWRHLLVQLLNALDKRPPEKEGVVARIRRLSGAQRIPREIAALMISVAEMRNSSEYRSKRPSQLEGEAIRNSWLAIAEWATRHGIKFEA